MEYQNTYGVISDTPPIPFASVPVADTNSDAADDDVADRLCVCLRICVSNMNGERSCHQ